MAASETGNPGAAVVLAGGKSLRLGRDKAAVDVGGRSLLARMVNLARRFCPLTVVAGRDPAPLVAGVPWFLDDLPGIGPMGGIVTALERIGLPCLVLSCDLPLLDEATLAKLLDAWRARPEETVMTTFVQTWTGYIEALVAVYQPEAAAVLRRANEKGCRKLSKAIPAALRHCVPYGADESRPFFNVNTQEDLVGMHSLTARLAPSR
jgi:molybdopterin-guanine dinucleotide biosynthesis protein A